MIAQLSNDYIRTRPAKVWTRLVSYGLEGRPVTTRGRYINPLVFAFHRAAASAPQLREIKKPIFILGSGRSGTTVLGLVLSMHRDVGFLNEPKALWHMINAHEDVIGNYSEGEARYRLGSVDATSFAVTTARRLYGAYLLLAGARRVVDKYPELVFRVDFVRSLFPDAKFVLLVRNGWDTALSIQQWSRVHRKEVNGTVHDWWGVNRKKWKLMCKELVPSEPLLASAAREIEILTSEADMGAVEWILTMNEGLRVARRYPDDVKLLRLEDLLQKPRDFLADVATFCELAPDEVLLAYSARTLRPGQRYSPYPMASSIQPSFEAVMRELNY